MKTNPRDFLNFPGNSVFENSETEEIALNVMKILARTHNTFRLLTWDEYVFECRKDGVWLYVLEQEKPLFEKVVGYCQSAEKAASFSHFWSR